MAEKPAAAHGGGAGGPAAADVDDAVRRPAAAADGDGSASDGDGDGDGDVAMRGGGAGAAAAVAPIVAPPGAPFTDAEYARALEVLSWTLRVDDATWASKPCQPLRRLVARMTDRDLSRRYGGRDVTAFAAGVEQSKKERTRVARQAHMDRLNLQKTALRAQRLTRVSQMVSEMGEELGFELPAVPDGAVDVGTDARLLIADGTAAAAGSAAEAGSGADADAGAATGSGTTEGGGALTVAGSAPGGGAIIVPPPKLDFIYRACYVCKLRYQQLHQFYDTLCPDCAALNWRKRNQLADMRGRVALVTGGRVKIGFHVALKLLRAGAAVVVTSRFPNDAADRFAEQPDFGVWKERLHVYGIDFRDLAALEAFCDMMLRDYPRLDVIVNNACQTVRRPPSYFKHLVPKEVMPLAALSDATRPLVERNHALHTALDRAGPSLLLDRTAEPLVREAGDGDVVTLGVAAVGATTGASDAAATAALRSVEAMTHAPDSAPTVTTLASTAASPAAGSDAAAAAVARSSALLTQMPLVAGDAEHDPELFPTGARDVNNQQIDLRRHNSWLMRMHEVSTPELAEVMAINAMAPFIISARLKPLMMKGRVFPADMPVMSPLKASKLGLRREARPNVSGGGAASAGGAGEGGTPSSAAGAAGGSGAAASSADDDGAEAPGEDARASGPSGGVKRRRTSKGAAPAAAGSDEPWSPSNGAILGARSPPIPASICRFIVQVSAVEGKFNRFKMPTHPHTNMAKAALNMMTRTSSTDYAEHFIFMNAVDTGWINDENPLHRAAATAVRNNFHTPIDEIDAAARILDPVFAPLLEAEEAAAVAAASSSGGSASATSAAGAGAGAGADARSAAAGAAADLQATCTPIYGAFLKDYKVSEW